MTPDTPDIFSKEHTLPETLSSAHLYYQIDNFYANHRQYVKSRSYPQLRGTTVSGGDVSTLWSGALSNEDIPVNKSYTGVSLKSTDIAYPCGLIGKYRFTDVFSLSYSNGTSINQAIFKILNIDIKNIKINIYFVTYYTRAFYYVSGHSHMLYLHSINKYLYHECCCRIDLNSSCRLPKRMLQYCI